MIKWVGRALGVLVVIALIGIGVFFTILPGIVENGRNAVTEHDPYEITPEAQALHADMLIGDLHTDSLMWNRDLLERGTRGHADLPRLREGNIGLQVFTTVTKSPAGQNLQSNTADARDNITPLAIAQKWPLRSWNNLTERGLYMASRLTDLADEAPDELRVIKNVQDLDAVIAACAEGKSLIGGLIGSEGGHILEGDLANIQRIYDAGFRLVGLTHFFDNALGGSLHGQSGEGLTAFGRAVVEDMMARSMIIDLAHASPQMARDVISMAAETSTPLMVSHTGIHSNCSVVRNFPDDLMQDIVKTGGIIGIGFWRTVTCDASPAGIARTIESAINLLGAEHVALGSDFDGAVRTTLDASELAIITQALQERGVSEQDIRAVMGANMVRFLRATLPQ